MLKFLIVGINKFNVHSCINLILLNILLCSVFFNCNGQITATISQPRLNLVNDSLMIKYDILGSNPDDKFNIRLEITDAAGAKINAAALIGDIGDNVKGGSNKQIVWNLSADNIFINSNINVEIFAKKIIISEIVTQEKELTELSAEEGKKEDIADKKKSHKFIEEPIMPASKVKLGKHLLQSAILPGWGLTSLSNGKPYWLIGVAGAGCVASSLYFNQKAYSSYNDYLDSNIKENFDEYYSDAKTQDKISKAFAWSAAAIWIADLGILSIKARSMNKSYKKGKLNSFSIDPCIDANTDTPMLFLYYNF